MIATFDKKIATAFHREVQETLRQVAAKHGLTFVPGNAKYGPNSISVKGEFKTADAPTRSDALARDLNHHLAMLYGVENVEAIKKVDIGGYRLVGFKYRSPKKPWVISDTAGKNFITRDEHVELYLERAGFKSKFKV
jgi:hypothetical protein